jgi:hypothetical protein
MNNDPSLPVKEVLEGQRTHGDKTFSQKPEMFGREPSDPALKAAELFKQEGKSNLLELGGGQGRDTLFFAREGFLADNVIRFLHDDSPFHEVFDSPSLSESGRRTVAQPLTEVETPSMRNRLERRSAECYHSVEN